MSVHYFVIEDPLGVFHVERKAKRGALHGRFGSREEACQHAKKLKRDYLSPAYDKFGSPLTPAQRAYLGVWHRDEYQKVLTWSALYVTGAVKSEPRPQAVTA